MARNVLPDQYYSFNASTRKITIRRPLKREQLLLITNVTTNTVIYNFSDPNLKATGFANFVGNASQGAGGTIINANSYVTNTSLGLAGSNNDTWTEITLNYNTTSMGNSDKLQIIVDEYEIATRPAETQLDPVGKLRTSSPQALIDTDFEYGLQPTKWEQLSTINNKMGPYVYLGLPLLGRNQGTQTTISSITATNNSRFIQVALASATGFAIGQFIYVTDTTWGPADGFFIIEALSGNTITYRAREAWTTGASASTSLLDADYPTLVYDAPLFSNGGFGGTITASVSGQVVTITCSKPHNLEIGNWVAVRNDQNSSTTVAGVATSTYGTHCVTGVTSPYIFTYYTDSATGTAGTFSADNLIVIPTGTSKHRAFDGGVHFSTNNAFHNQQLVRQTRRYFRYQSGKGVQISTGTSLKSQLYVEQITASGSTVTVSTKYPHGILPGAFVRVLGCNESGYNSTINIATGAVSNFQVTSVIDNYRFTYTATTSGMNSPASGTPSLTVDGWYGHVNRCGLFDDQNGIFFEHDGQTQWIVRRASTTQLAGYGAVNANDYVVSSTAITNPTGAGSINTLFSKQLVVGDYVVIRGATYKVMEIVSDTEFHIAPQFRGETNVTRAVISKRIDTRIPQSQWNLDRLDGTGPSGYIMDPAKMQMFYMDFSWYGAGFIRWGVRTQDGNVIYCHKVVNNNQNQEAWMRSGNLSARYESNTTPVYTQITSTVNQADTTINVSSTTGFPSVGTALIHGTTGSSSGVFEYFNYTGTTTTSFTGCTRGQSGSSQTVTATQGATQLTVSSAANIQIGQMVYTGTIGQIPHSTFVTAISGTTITLSRALTNSISASTVYFSAMAQTPPVTHTYSATRPIQISLHSPQSASTIQHWGTSVIMDGRFDDDKSFVFTRGSTAAFGIGATQYTRNAIMGIRVAPMVNNGQGASAQGLRDLINRMQLVLRGLDVYSNGSMLIEVILNGYPQNNYTWLNQTGASLAQYFIYSAANTVLGGETIGGFYLNPPGTIGSTSYTTTGIDLNSVRDLGNSVLGGGSADTQSKNGNHGSACQMYYPNGPDVVTIMATQMTSTASNLYSRLSWTEAQA
jgi:hypothetical protein